MQKLEGKTALITGASSGIGEAIATRLAEKGVDLVIIARSEEKLNNLAQKLMEIYAINVKCIVQDLRNLGPQNEIRSFIECSGRNIDILINNAGFGTYGAFETICPDAEQDEIAVNISAIVNLTHLVVPGMLKRGYGNILNIASTAAFQPVPFMAVYSASKAFVLNFSEALWAEYQDRGIHVTALCPGPVATGFFDVLGVSSVKALPAFATRISPDVVADQAMVSLSCCSPSHIIGVLNWLKAQSVRFVPRSVVAQMGAKMLRPRSDSINSIKMN